MITFPSDAPAVALETLPPRSTFSLGDPAGLYMVLQYPVLPEYGVPAPPDTVPCVDLRTGRAYAFGRYSIAHPVPVTISVTV